MIEYGTKDLLGWQQEGGLVVKVEMDPIDRIVLVTPTKPATSGFPEADRHLPRREPAAARIGGRSWFEFSGQRRPAFKERPLSRRKLQESLNVEKRREP